VSYCSDLGCAIVESAFLCLQLFYSFFKSLVGKDVVVELKNDLRFVFTGRNNLNAAFCRLLDSIFTGAFYCSLGYMSDMCIGLNYLALPVNCETDLQFQFSWSNKQMKCACGCKQRKWQEQATVQASIMEMLLLATDFFLVFCCGLKVSFENTD